MSSTPNINDQATVSYKADSVCLIQLAPKSWNSSEPVKLQCIYSWVLHLHERISCTFPEESMGQHEAFGYLKLHDRTLQKQKIVSLTPGTTFKNTACFHFCEWTQQHTDIWNLKLNRNDSRGYPKEIPQLVEEKEVDTATTAVAREVLCKSFIQQFWQLNLCSYKQWHCFDSLCSLLLWKWKSRNKTKPIIPGSTGNQLVLFS